jgi:hypothetical protein
MATAAVVEPANSVRLPSGEAADDRRVMINSKLKTGVHIFNIDEEGQGSVTELGHLPVSTTEIYTQHRMCGDYYCFIHCGKQVSAIGKTVREAFANALKLARAS